MIVVLFIIVIVAYFILKNKIQHNGIFIIENNIYGKIENMIFCSIISFLTPLSWIIFAKPHTIIHHELIPITWYIPTIFFFISTILYICFFIYYYIKKETVLKRSLFYNLHSSAPNNLLISIPILLQN